MKEKSFQSIMGATASVFCRVADGSEIDVMGVTDRQPSNGPFHLSEMSGDGKPCPANGR
jgi:hypothetical protein